MSASLVGSEMCIRDRRAAVGTWAPRATSAFSASGRATSRRPRSSTRRRAAVGTWALRATSTRSTSTSR
eukprot:865012-Alexandrium_andersonii.AAC.1